MSIPPCTVCLREHDKNLKEELKYLTPVCDVLIKQVTFLFKGECQDQLIFLNFPKRNNSMMVSFTKTSMITIVVNSF